MEDQFQPQTVFERISKELFLSQRSGTDAVENVDPKSAKFDVGRQVLNVLTRPGAEQPGAFL